MTTWRPWDAREEPFGRLYEAVNLLASQVRKVAGEDKAAIVDGGMSFDIHALVGGQMERDTEAQLYLLYPEGNWVDTGRLTPYHIIGATGYGKPVLDRALKFEDSMRHAFKVGCLSFDSTRISSADVGYPLDAVLCPNNSFEVVQRRFRQEEMAPLSDWWQERMRQAVHEIPSKMIDVAFDELKVGHSTPPSDRQTTT